MIEYDADMEPGQFYYTLKKRVEKYFVGNQVGLIKQSLAGCCAPAASTKRAGCKTWVVAAMLGCCCLCGIQRKATCELHP